MACLDLEEVAANQKGCAVTQSFSDRVEDRATMEQAVAARASRLGEKLRREGLGTDHVTVFFHTSEHDRTRPQRSVSTVVTLPEASNDTMVPVKAALHGVRKTWRDVFRYSKAGVVTTDLLPFHASQRAIPGLGQIDREQGAALMAALRTRGGRPGRRRLRAGAWMVDEVRDALAALHDPPRRNPGRRGLSGSRQRGPNCFFLRVSSSGMAEHRLGTRRQAATSFPRLGSLAFKKRIRRIPPEIDGRPRRCSPDQSRPP